MRWRIDGCIYKPGMAPGASHGGSDDSLLARSWPPMGRPVKTSENSCPRPAEDRRARLTDHHTAVPAPGRARHHRGGRRPHRPSQRPPVPQRRHAILGTAQVLSLNAKNASSRRSRPASPPAGTSTGPSAPHLPPRRQASPPQLLPGQEEKPTPGPATTARPRSGSSTPGPSPRDQITLSGIAQGPLAGLGGQLFSFLGKRPGNRLPSSSAFRSRRSKSGRRTSVPSRRSAPRLPSSC